MFWTRISYFLISRLQFDQMHLKFSYSINYQVSQMFYYFFDFLENFKWQLNLQKS